MPDAELLSPLKALRALGQGNLAGYYVRLAEHPEPILRVAAWRGLFEHRDIPVRLHAKLLEDCRYAAVRSRAFDYFEGIFDHELAKQAAETTVDNPEDARLARMRGQLAEDVAMMLAAEEQRFLGSAEVAHLVAATVLAEQASGWRAATAMAARGFVAFPQSAQLILAIFRMLDGADQSALLRVLADYLVAARPLSHLGELAGAIADQLEGDSSRALSRLDKLLADTKLTGPLAPFLGSIKKARADALHKLGQYNRAYSALVDLNAYDKANSAQTVDPAEYKRSVVTKAALAIPSLPHDPRSDVVVMLGFPRSGTTLLENALAAHPLIETFEEIPSQAAAVTYISRALADDKHRPTREEDIYLEARKRFYGEIDRRRRRPAAAILIDKMPIRSGDAKFHAKLFPERRHIFSIRHPYDVVFSCFRQRFAPNPAMENFRTIEDGARLYDFVMRQWFDTHPLDDASVCYVRYESLVKEFEDTASRTLAFLGLEWSDEMLSFAKKAEERAAKTPSYQKVRQGLSIGVQSNWKYYKFAFDRDTRQLLNYWTEFFGYEGT